ncbi:MAG: prolyl oligopeptidase family serine peptidase [Clostridia bacterium]|nr:prolyl oligopeptidase family serine peptidase [Clostridia bacterium]
MEKIINAENLRSFAYSNDDKVVGKIKGIIVFFVGLGGCSMYNDGNPWADSFAEKGVVFVIPYHNPWAWMNRQTVDFTDEIIDVIFKKHDLDESTPVVSCGGSMGGLSSIVYTAYSKRTPASCVASCPVCDLPYHFTERVDLPRTLYTAFASYEGTLEDALRSASPLHLVDRLPTATDYTVFHCDKDTAVNIEKHSNRFVELMKREHDITYYVIPDRGHCDLGEEMNAFYDALLLKKALRENI